MHLLRVRLTRCISIRDSAGFHAARCAKASGSKSAPSSRLSGDQHVAIEGRRHACRIVVRRQQCCFILHQVHAQQQAVARLEPRAHPSSSVSASCGSKFPMLEPI